MLIDRYKFFLSQPIPQGNLDYNLGQNKMEEQANRSPNPPPPAKKVEDEAAQKPKRAIFLALIVEGGGGGGGRRGINFQFLLSKIFYR